MCVEAGNNTVKPGQRNEEHPVANISLRSSHVCSDGVFRDFALLVVLQNPAVSKQDTHIRPCPRPLPQAGAPPRPPRVAEGRPQAAKAHARARRHHHIIIGSPAHTHPVHPQARPPACASKAAWQPLLLLPLLRRGNSNRCLQCRPPLSCLLPNRSRNPR